MYAREFQFTTTNKTLVVGPNKFSSLRTSCLEAEAYDPRDKERILEALQQDHMTVEQIDELVLQYRTHEINPGEDVRRRPLRRSVVLLIAAIAALAIAYGVNWSDSDTLPTKLMPLPDPPGRATGVSFLPAYSVKTINKSPLSPQGRALSWVLNHTNDQDLDWQRTQVFALATFYYAAHEMLDDGTQWLRDPYSSDFGCYWVAYGQIRRKSDRFQHPSRGCITHCLDNAELGFRAADRLHTYTHWSVDKLARPHPGEFTNH
jgi:hypothetical protein